MRGVQPSAGVLRYAPLPGARARHRALQLRCTAAASSSRDAVRTATHACTSRATLTHAVRTVPQSASVVEAAATAVLASRLLSQNGITCAVDCSLPGLLSGRVEAARITGTAWQSRKSLTCRSLDFAVGRVEIDAAAVMTRAVLALRAPARGAGTVVFTPADFGNFLAHPLFVAAAARAVAGRRFAFASRGVSFDPTGSVRFSGALNGANYACALYPPPVLAAATQRGGSTSAPPPARAVRVVAAGGPDADAVSAALSRFFTSLVIDLEGTRLTYADIALAPDAATLTLRLALEVTRFPRADFAF
jgi:hypothetical protein